MRILLASIFLAVLGIMGCSGGSTPISPESPASQPAYERPDSPGSLDNLPVIDVTTYPDGTFEATGIMGAYELNIDPAKMTTDLVSKRLPTALGASWTVSGIGFFTIAPCSDCLKIGSIALTPENYLQLNFAIRHPFKPGNTSLPPSAVNRLDLDVFDLALVVAPIGATPVNFSLLGVNTYPGILANNAGYTTELSNVTGDRAAMPYALVVDDSTGGGSTWNEFPMGADSFFDVFFDLNTMTTFSFDMYLTMGYGQSAQGKAQRLTPTYFNPEFNKKQAWKVVVTPPQGTDPPAMGNTWQNNDSTTTFNVKVEVYDWQHNATSIVTPPVNSGDIAEISMSERVFLEILGMTLTPAEAATPTGGNGTPPDPLVYEIPIANQNLLPAGEYIGLVKVVDTRIPTTSPPGDGIDFVIDSPDGIALNNYGIPEYATYQTFTATVVVGCGPITGSVVSPSCPVTGVAHTERLDFTVTASSGNGGDPIVLYECDYDYNGTTFTSDFSSPTGVFNNVGPFLNPNCPTPTPVNYTVAFRATDSCTPPNTTIFATCLVTVDTCCGPLTGPGTVISPSCPANVRNGGQLTFQLGAYNSPGSTVTYYIDYDWDGVPANFTEDDSSTTGTFAPHTYVNATTSDITYTTGFKVKDTCTPPNEEILTTTCTVTVHADASPVGNVTMVVNRTQVTNGYPFTTSGPWTLNWSAANNAHAYAIYYDNDPTGAPGGYTDNLVYVAETSSTSYTVPSSHLPSNHYIIGYTYVVRSRSVSGDSSSEAANSEPAHIKTNGWETQSSSLLINGEGWLHSSEFVPTSAIRGWYTTTSYPMHGSRNSYLGIPFYLGRIDPGYQGRYCMLTKYAPMDVPSSNVRFLDMPVHMRVGTAGTTTYGLIMGTSPTQPTTPWPNPSIVEWAYSASGGATPALEPYNSQQSVIPLYFSGVDTTGNYCWSYQGGTQLHRFGSNVNNGGDSTDNYVAIVGACLALNSVHPISYWDEIAIMIY